MRTKTRQISAITLAVLAILAISTGGAFAAINYSTGSGDNTATSSDVSGSSATVDLRPGNSSEYTYIEVNSTRQSNMTLKLRPEDSDGDVVDYVAYENTSPNNITTADGGARTHWGWNISHDELEDLPRDVDGETYRLEIYNDTDDDDDVLNTTVTFDQKGDNVTAVIAVADTTEATFSGLADRVEISEEFGWFGAESVWSDNGTTVSSYSAYTNVNGSNTTVEVHLENTSTADAYSEAAENYEDGDWIHGSTMWVNGVPLKTYKNEAPDDLGSDVPHAIYDADNDEVELVLDDGVAEFEDFRTVQIRAGAGDGYGFGTLISEFGASDAAASLWMT